MHVTKLALCFTMFPGVSSHFVLWLRTVPTVSLPSFLLCGAHVVITTYNALGLNNMLLLPYPLLSQ